MKQALTHPWLVVRCQIALGALFVAAAIPKLVDPPSFAKTIWAYDLFPAWSVHPLALGLPWMEALTGLALCLGLWVREATVWVSTFLVAFILALSFNLLRGHPVDCGCFSTPTGPRTTQERLVDMRWAILRDLGMLLLALPTLLPRRPDPCD